MTDLSHSHVIDDRLSRFVAISLGAHIIIVAIFIVKVALFPSESIDFSAAVRVDLVGLPEKVDTLPAPSPESTPPPAPAKIAEPKKPEPVVVEKPQAPVTVPTPSKPAVDLKKKQNTAIERLKALAELEAEMAAKKSAESNATAKPIRGNVISPGTALRGIQKLDYDAYIGDVDHHIKAHWVLPEWLAKAGLRARAKVRIDENGLVIDRRLIESSRNPQYDALVIDAIDRASPFPKPPEKFVQLVEIDGIIFQFPD